MSAISGLKGKTIQGRAPWLAQQREATFLGQSNPFWNMT